MTSGRSAHGSRLLGALVACLLATLPIGCACPPVVERWDTPLATLELWQARLCRDDSPGEYACFSLGFQNTMKGFQYYYMERTSFLEREPAAAWLFSHADLADRVLETQMDPDGQHAVLVLDAGDERLEVAFEREAWITVTWDDGKTETARQRAPFPALVAHDARSARQLLAVARPELHDPEHVREVLVTGRWLIANIAGLQPEGATP